MSQLYLTVHVGNTTYSYNNKYFFNKKFEFKPINPNLYQVFCEHALDILDCVRRALISGVDRL